MALDFSVDNVDQTVQAALEAGATLEISAATYEWGRIAQMSDPFGHGLCILQFIGKGYDAVATAVKGPEPGTHF